MSARLSAVWIVLASVGCSVAAVLWLRQPPAARSTASPAPASTPAKSIGPRLDALEARLALLEAELEESRLAAPVPSSDRVAVQAAEESTTEGSAAGADLARRIALLERRLAGVERDAEPPSPAEQLAQELERERAREQSILDAKRALADASASRDEKLAAHEALRRVPDAYTPGMVADLVHLGANDADPSARADVWRNFDGASHLPELVPHLLRALEGDPDAGPRNEAAETLGNYADDPAVMAALRHAAEHDPSPEVRAKAKRTLAELMWLAEER